MNIVLMTDLVFPGAGGVEVMMDKIAAGLIKRGHRLKMISALPSRSYLRRDETGGLENARLYMGLPEAGIAKTWPLFLTKACASHKSLQKEIREFDADVVNIHFPGSAAFYAWLIKTKTNIPMVVSLHGNDIQLFPFTSTSRRMALRRLLDQADYVTTCSQKIMTDARTSFDFTQNATVIRNGVDLSEFPAPGPACSDSQYILAAGRLVHKKGFDLLIRAFGSISAKYPKVKLVIAGDGDMKKPLMDLIDELSLGSRIELKGHVSRDGLLDLFAGCRFFVLPSRREPLGIVNLEAMAAGRAVVAFAVDGVVEIIDDGVGILVEAENTTMLAAAIDKLLSDPALADSLGKEGSNRVLERHSMDIAIDKYLQIYEQVINEGGNRR